MSCSPLQTAGAYGFASLVAGADAEDDPNRTSLHYLHPHL